MAHLHKKMKKGRPYYYIREIARVGGKPTVVSQVYLGSLERMLEMSRGTGGDDSIVKIKSEEFGALWLANLIDQEIDIAGLIDSVIPKGKKETGPSVGEYFLYAVFNRMIDACSKRSLPDWYADNRLAPTTATFCLIGTISSTTFLIISSGNIPVRSNA